MASAIIRLCIVFLVIGDVWVSIEGRRSRRGKCKIPDISGATFRGYNRGHPTIPLLPGRKVPSTISIRVICDKDVYHDAIHDSTLVRCYNSRWIPEMPSCKEYKRCKAIPRIPNSVASERTNPYATFPHETEVTYTCDAGMRMIGNNTIVCTDGKWSLVDMRCQADELKTSEPQTSPTVQTTQRPTTRPRPLPTTYRPRRSTRDTRHTPRTWPTRSPVPTGIMPPKRGSGCLFEDQTVQYNILSRYLDTDNDSYTADNTFQDGRRHEHGTVIQIQCSDNTYPYLGVRRASCMDGQWLPRQPECKGYCMVPQSILQDSSVTVKNTRMSSPHFVMHGTSVRQICTGIVTRKVRHAKCLDTQWSKKLLDCTRIKRKLIRSGISPSGRIIRRP